MQYLFSSIISISSGFLNTLRDSISNAFMGKCRWSTNGRTKTIIAVIDYNFRYFIIYYHFNHNCKHVRTVLVVAADRHVRRVVAHGLRRVHRDDKRGRVAGLNHVMQRPTRLRERGRVAEIERPVHGERRRARIAERERPRLAAVLDGVAEVDRAAVGYLVNGEVRGHCLERP